MGKYIKWTYELLKEEALKYNTRSDFSKGSTNAYRVSLNRNILDSICLHMNNKYVSWTDDMLKDEALKYNTRIDFIKGSTSAYYLSLNRGILDSICSHMIRLGDIYNRFIYTIEFENNSMYIGLTNNLERRNLEHINNSSNKYIKEFINKNILYTFNSDNILYSTSEAIEIECSLIEKFKNNGYNVLNISKGGGLGKSNKWSVETLRKEALKYKTIKEFIKSNINAYNSAIRKGILDDICSHMIKLRTKWTNDMLKNEALKYNTRTSFQKGSNAYQIAYKMGILDDICTHMKNIKL